MKRVLVSVLIVAIILSGVEFSLRARAKALPAYQTMPEYERLRHWPAFGVDASAYHLTDQGFFVADDVSSQYVNITNGIRRTTDQPATYRHTLYLFGSSTLISINVPDAYTIASYLQRLTPEVRVMNLGALGHDIVQQFARLRTVDFQPGDSAVFYVGLMEGENAVKGAERDTSFALCHQLRLLDALCRTLPNDTIADHAKSITERFASTLNDARSYARTHGIALLIVLQPHLYTRALSRYEQAVADSLDVSEDVAYKMIWQRLRPMVDLDLTHVLDPDRAAGEEFYIDPWHVDEKANAIIAAAMLPIIREAVRERCTAIL
jgi:hypothetical protein